MPGNKDNTIAIIPAYNEEETIREVVKNTKRYINKVIVINDASSDKTSKEAKSAGADVIEHAINIGIGGSLKIGYYLSIEEGYKYIIQLDGDGQHNPRYIPKFLKEIKNADIVIGSRYFNKSIKKYSKIRKIGIGFFSYLVKNLGRTKLTDVTSGFRIYNVSSLKKLTPISDRHWAVEQTLEALRKGFVVREISVKMPIRKKGKSQFVIKTYLLYPIRMINIIIRVMLFR